MTLRMELWVEGRTDAPTARPQDDGTIRPVVAGGALVPLVRKVLENAKGMTPEALAAVLPETEMHAFYLTAKQKDVVGLGGWHQRLKLSNKGKKTLAAIDKARTRDGNVLILAVWDRDGEDEPLEDRDIIIRAIHDRGETGVAVGICVEEIESWLLADPGAFARSFGQGPTAGLPGKPEDERDPKKTLNAMLARYPNTDDRVAAYRKVATAIDLERLTRSCPRGFGEFRKALQDFIIPHLRARQA